ncbi:MAG: hypothetical protein ABIP03_10795 [Aquihabitans sp.]
MGLPTTSGWHPFSGGISGGRGIRWERSEPVCYDRQDEVQDQIIPEVDHDIVVLFQRAFDDPTYPAVLVDRDRLTLNVGSAEQNRAIAVRTGAVVDALTAAGAWL